MPLHKAFECIYIGVMLCAVLASFVATGLVTSNENEDEYLTQRENILEKSYHGLIRENETLVEITPLIKVDEEKICNFRILKKPYHEIPFEIQLVNNLGILKARRTLNCEKRKSYHFEIIAIYCDGTPSNTANVHITVIDINEYAPTFLEQSYVTEVDEGRLYNEIIRVEASDKDCTPLFGDVCKYEILNNDEPFAIDNEGSVKNTEPLSHKASHNHILSVVAFDCAMKESAAIMVSIKVRRVCDAKFIGIPERIDYTSGSTESLQLFPNTRLDLCDISCNNEDLSIHASIALKTKHISFGCDRDISNCTSSLTMKDLLPQDAEWTKDLNYDEGAEPIYHFDGSAGVVVPDAIVDHYDFSMRSFSILTIFRHSSQSSTNKHVKEHILCNADDHKMNRHHMALFVRNCRLILLLRKNFNEGDLNIFSPAEWRWKIPQVCDNEWHHYVLNIEQFGKVELFIDGIRFESSIEDSHSNPEVIDDWPLHAAHGVNTTLAVGACYQSSENRLKHGFNGDISEVKIALYGILTTEDIKCGTNCAEHLMSPNDLLVGQNKISESDFQIQANEEMNEIYIEAQTKHNIEQLMRKIQYINIKQNPTIGRRNIEVRTSLMCNNHSSIRLPTIETYIMVNEPIGQVGINVGSTSVNDKMDTRSKNKVKKMKSLFQKDGLDQDVLMETRKITITGTSNKLVSYQEIKLGVHILDKIHIATSIKNSKQITAKEYLDSCSVVVFPSLNPDHEEIQIDGDESLSSTMDIKTNINKDGVEMMGMDSIHNYLNVLRSLIYSNKKPAYYLNRVFKLSCGQLSSQFKSAEYTLTLTVLHPKQSLSKTTNAPQPASLSQVNNAGNPNTAAAYLLNGGVTREDVNQASDIKVFSYSLLHTNDIQEPKSHIHSIVHKVEGSHPTMLIILICVFLVILLCGVSIARIKNNHKYTDRHQPCPKIADDGLIWDDSALTITINPMQTDAVSEDSSDSENSDSEDDEALKDGFAHINQLEWDNTNIFSTAN
ncbi:calsyntenin-1 isoform X1 [Drosophila subobscura]|uniref:calsyntenin-1 isoform X1 n=1 Tax=Drosophila subobscura TaxID=7241 RepID=UPI00155B0DE5|nr:calsyntenin-1 isoform X1 [Drosophila subobscura]XP_034670363.1 calsyntenin-1 isoform X1 [Drosophila subobscura]XP_034670364.1 calsyntenin-1 isoform X1 [Drosophila subobscura]